MAVGEAVTVPGASCVREAESHRSAAMVGEARLRDLRAGAGFNNLSLINGLRAMLVRCQGEKDGTTC